MSALENRERLEYIKQDHTDEDDMKDVCFISTNFGKWIMLLWVLHNRIY